jgi:hypothetical protein
LRGRKESCSEEDDRGRRERASEKDGEEVERGVVRRRRERGSEEVDGEASLPLSLLPLSHPHYLSPPSTQSSSPPLHPSFLSIRHLITSLLFPVILSSTSLPLSFFRLHPPY